MYDEIQQHVVHYIVRLYDKPQEAKRHRALVHAPELKGPRKAGADRGRHGDSGQHHDPGNDENYARVAQGLERVIGLKMFRPWFLETQIDQEGITRFGENIPRSGDDPPPYDDCEKKEL